MATLVLMTEEPESYLPRLADATLAELLADFPALLVVGPRATGKTTTAARFAKTVLRLDQPRVAQAVAADPDAVLRGLDEPILIDEWQLAPSVLGAVKRAVDTGRSRFIVTGSAHGRLDQPTWPGTGRLIQLGMTGLTVRELVRGDLKRPSFVELVAAGAEGLPTPADPPDLRGYLEFAVRGGFPESALEYSGRGYRIWLESYLEQLFQRDVSQVDRGRDPELLRRYFQAYALNTAGVVPDQAVFDAAGINRKTAEAYERLLVNLFVVERIPAWHSNRFKRLVRTPKRYVVDPGLVAGTLGLDVNDIITDADVLGRVIDTFVIAQLRAELRLGGRGRLYHLRDRNGEHEIDIVVELGHNRVVAIEVKAHSAPDGRAAKHLRWLRDKLGDGFLAGVVLHTGPFTYQLDDRIVAAPICTIWS
jgi:predicted AAA+ superfamily ATPase